MSRRVVFISSAIADFNRLTIANIKLAKKVFELIESIEQSPFDGLGKPEPLKQQLKGKWSRRISDEHRLVYEVTNDEIVVFSCYGHYI